MNEIMPCIVCVVWMYCIVVSPSVSRSVQLELKMWSGIGYYMHSEQSVTIQQKLFYSFFEIISLIIRLSSRYCFPIVDSR